MVSVSSFASLVDIPIGIGNSAVGLEICGITGGVEKYESILKEKRNKHDKIVLLAKTKLNTAKVLNYKVLTDADICCDEFVLVSGAMKEYNDMKETIKNHKSKLKTKEEYNNLNKQEIQDTCIKRS